MPTLIRANTVTARKRHRCQTCGTVCAEPGQTYHRETYVYDDRVYNWTCCDECLALTAEVWVWAGRPDEGVYAETYDEWADESKRDPEWGERARAYLARRVPND